MPTARERMLELSSLPSGNTARAHFLSIVQENGLQIYDALDVELDMCDYEVVMEPEFTVQLQEEEYQVTLENNDFEVEVC